jgi:hypothetical protein
MVKFIKDASNFKTFGIPLPLFVLLAIIVFYPIIKDPVLWAGDNIKALL